MHVCKVVVSQQKLLGKSFLWILESLLGIYSQSGIMLSSLNSSFNPETIFLLNSMGLGEKDLSSFTLAWDLTLAFIWGNL